MSKKKFPTSYAERKSALTALRNVKMARSAHAYVRGSTAKFYEWLTTSDAHKIPQGPAVWICGDCHIGNLGPVGNAKNHVNIEIRDLDQTVMGNPAHDLIRLGLSLASAARGSDLSGVITAQMLEQMVVGYEYAFEKENEGGPGHLKKPETVALGMKKALGRTWKHLAKERIEDTKPTIPLGDKFWPLTEQEREEVKRLMDEDAVKQLVNSLHSREDDAVIELLDAAYWVKGCSSLGNLRYAVLLRVGGKSGELCILDLKEAIPALAPHAKRVRMPKYNAERVLRGAKALSPALGNRMLAARFLNKSVFIRELLPQDIKFEIEGLSAEEAVKAAKYFAFVVGKSHARQMDAATRTQWQNELARHRTKTLDAPSWLWSSIVELMATHEAAYLEHCRRYTDGALVAPV